MMLIEQSKIIKINVKDKGYIEYIYRIINYASLSSKTRQSFIYIHMYTVDTFKSSTLTVKKKL